MLTDRQWKVFRPILSAAWRTYCARTGTVESDRIAKDKWYRQALASSVGIFSTKQVAPKDQGMFDKLCLCFATLSGDDKQINYWSRAAERRAMWRLEQTMKKAAVSLQYVEGIARNMNFIFLYLEDLPAEHILKINTAVYKHWKRKEHCA